MKLVLCSLEESRCQCTNTISTPLLCCSSISNWRQRWWKGPWQLISLPPTIQTLIPPYPHSKSSSNLSKTHLCSKFSFFCLNFKSLIPSYSMGEGWRAAAMRIRVLHFRTKKRKTSATKTMSFWWQGSSEKISRAAHVTKQPKCNSNEQCAYWQGYTGIR